MKLVTTVNGTGATLYLGLGVLPNKVRVRNIEAADMAEIYWEEGYRAGAIRPAGVLMEGTSDTDMDRTALTYGAGVELYYGEDIIATASSAYQILAHMVEAYAGDMRSKGAATADKWTLTTAATPSGKFNNAINTTYVGVGSRVYLRPVREGPLYVTRITALSNDGDADDEVTISEAVPSGTVERIDYLYGMANAPANRTMPQGIIIKETAKVNLSGSTLLIEAEW